jgi:hypothetical protein
MKRRCDDKIDFKIRGGHAPNMFSYLLKLFQQGHTKVPLGRWGNHWESRLKYQKYYD